MKSRPHFKNFIPFFLYIIVILVVYNQWLLKFGILTHGDWPFFWRETMISVRGAYFTTWINDYSFIENAFGRTPLDIGQAPINALYGFLAHYFGLEFNIIERVIHFWPTVIIGPLGCYLLLKKIFKNSWAIVTGLIIFSFNTYFLVLQTSHIQIMTGFSFVPLMLASFHSALEKEKIKNSIITGLLLFVINAYEPRIYYISLGIVTAYGLMFILTRKKSPVPVLIPIVTSLLLGMYWILPLVALRTFQWNELFNRGIFGRELMDLEHALTLYHPFWTGTQPSNFIVQNIPFYFWIIPITAFLGLWMNRKNNMVVLFGFISMIGILLGKQNDEPLNKLYDWLFFHLPGFNAFREASKFYFLIVLGYAVLIPSFVEYLLRIKKNRMARAGIFSLVLLIAFLFLWNTRGIITKKIGTLFVQREIPSDYQAFKKFMDQQTGYFRTLWIPIDSRWGIYSLNHPKANALDISENPNYQNLLNPNGEKNKITQLIRSKYFQDLVNTASIRYIVIPERNNRNNEDIFKYPNDREIYKQELDQLSFLRPVDIGAKDVIVYENGGYQNHIIQSSGKPINTTMIRPTLYEMNVNNVSETTTIEFSETYHEGWKLTSKNDTKNAFPINEHKKTNFSLNTFTINPENIKKTWPLDFYTLNPDGSINLELKLIFEPQQYLHIGGIISILTLSMSIGYIVWDYSKKSNEHLLEQG